MQTTQTTTRWARDYETIYILHPRIEPAEAEKIGQRVSEVVGRLGGKLVRVDNWGKRKLAYKIQKQSRGIFVYVRYLGFSDLVLEIERNLRLFDSIMRFQTIQLRDIVNPDEIQVDPEDVKFQPIEVTEHDEEPSLAERLGMMAAARPIRTERAEGLGDEEAVEEGLGAELDGDMPVQEGDE